MQRFIALLGSNFGTRTMTTMLRYFGPAFALLGLLLTSATGFSQVFIMANETAETCTGSFCGCWQCRADGTGNPYPDENYTYTLCPDNPRRCGFGSSSWPLAWRPIPTATTVTISIIYDGPDAGSRLRWAATQAIRIARVASNGHGKQPNRVSRLLCFRTMGRATRLHPDGRPTFPVPPLVRPLLRSQFDCGSTACPTRTRMSVGVCLNEDRSPLATRALQRSRDSTWRAWVWNFDDGANRSRCTPRAT